MIARAIACGLMLLVLPSCGIPPIRRAELSPGLPDSFNGSNSPENSSRLGIEEFYNDPMLTCLIEKALVDNRELKILNEEIQVASNEVLARSGQYLPFVSVGAGAGLDRYSRFTIDGAAIHSDEYLPGQFLPNPIGNFRGGIDFTWRLDIYRQLRNARDAAGRRYEAAIERRNFFVTRLVAEIAENYYGLMALDKRLENLNQIIELQQRSYEIAKARKVAGRSNELGVLRFQAEVQRNQSEKLIVNQGIIEGENRINFLVNRFPQPVERVSDNFYDLNINTLYLGLPSQLLENRPDIRQAERDLAANGLDVKVARANFFPQLALNAGTGLQAFDVRYLFEPQATVGTIAAGLVGPLVNKRAIRADYLTANARQLQSIYDYQRVILNAFTEVINQVNMVENYSKSIEIKKQQLSSLEAAVQFANDFFQFARIEYIDVLFAQRDLRDARVVLIDTKLQQLNAIVNTYRALGGGAAAVTSMPVDFRGQFPFVHTIRGGENFRTLSRLYYRSGRYHKALWAANKDAIPDFDRLPIGGKLLIPHPDKLDATLVEEMPVPPPPLPELMPASQPAAVPPPPPPPSGIRSPFGPEDETKDTAIKSASWSRFLHPFGRTKDPAVQTAGLVLPSASPAPAAAAK